MVGVRGYVGNHVDLIIVKREKCYQAFQGNMDVTLSMGELGRKVFCSGIV